MLDPSFVRDNLDAVQKGMANRGLNVTTELQQLATAESHRRRLIPQIEGLKREQNSSGDEVARAKRQGQDAKHLFEASKMRAQKIKQLEVELDGAERQRTMLLESLPEPAACERAGRQDRRRQRGGADVGRTASLRLRGEGALGISGRSSASSTSSAPRKSPAHASRC